MKQSLSFIFWIAILNLLGCSPEAEKTNLGSASDIASVVSAQQEINHETQTASSEIASKILNSPQEQDILLTSRQAISSVNASDIASVNTASVVVSASEIAEVAKPLLPMVEECNQYFQRVERCFSRDNENSERLLEMNREAREEVAKEQPTAQECVELNSSFNAVARNLRCE